MARLQHLKQVLVEEAEVGSGDDDDSNDIIKKAKVVVVSTSSKDYDHNQHIFAHTANALGGRDDDEDNGFFFVQKNELSVLNDVFSKKMLGLEEGLQHEQRKKHKHWHHQSSSSWEGTADLEGGEEEEQEQEQKQEKQKQERQKQKHRIRKQLNLEDDDEIFIQEELQTKTLTLTGSIVGDRGGIIVGKGDEIKQHHQNSWLTKKQIMTPMEKGYQRHENFSPSSPSSWVDESRHLLEVPNFLFGNGSTVKFEFDTVDASRVSDVTVKSAMTTLGMNCAVFVVVIIAFEILSRSVPTVYRRKIQNLPRSSLPLAWVNRVARTSWQRVLEAGGLDAYMFLRFIRMCIRITAVSGLWGILILLPIYATGELNDVGWYLLSMANVADRSWRIWIPTLFMWFLTFFIMYVMNDEYNHFTEKRMEFLSGKQKITGDLQEEVHPQQPYSLMVEGIPNEMRSEKGLYDYFDELFPGKVHSTCMVLNIPDLESQSSKRMQIKRRLEKSIAYHEATGKRPVHVVGRKRVMILGIESITSHDCEPTWTGAPSDEGRSPKRGELVDSINYYWSLLGQIDSIIEGMQSEKLALAESHNDSVMASRLISDALDHATDAVSGALEFRSGGADAERDDGLQYGFRRTRGDNVSLLLRLGFDFVFAGVTFLYRHIDVVVDKVVGTTMSSTGFVTFTDLASATCAASAPLSDRADAFSVTIAPEPRDLNWENAHIDILWMNGRQWTANVLLGLGAILWSVPLTFIQAVASIESLSKVPGLQWLGRFADGPYAAFINGYLPVLALLGLILLLPIIFEYIAVHYEDRKTKSSVHESMVGRFFYYQLANIYVTVTAGSIWEGLAAIIAHPNYALGILGHHFPQVVGYFISLIITKTLAGLPVVLLRCGALSRRIFYKACFREDKLSQRELDEVYKGEMLPYGWEYPTQLLIIILCFTYACISPVILPFGSVYFIAALIVYKQQVLYMYTPTYEGGGALFPGVCHRTLIGLICGQITLMGYTLIKKGVSQGFALVPLPLLTLKMMGYFQSSYAQHSSRLSLERALDLDVRRAVDGMPEFTKDAYRQPVLVEEASGPLPYRRSESEDGNGTVYGGGGRSRGGYSSVGNESPTRPGNECLGVGLGLGDDFGDDALVSGTANKSTRSLGGSGGKKDEMALVPAEVTSSNSFGGFPAEQAAVKEGEGDARNLGACGAKKDETALVPAEVTSSNSFGGFPADQAIVKGSEGDGEGPPIMSRSLGSLSVGLCVGANGMIDGDCSARRRTVMTAGGSLRSVGEGGTTMTNVAEEAGGGGVFHLSSSSIGISGDIMDGEVTDITNSVVKHNRSMSPPPM